VTRHLPLEYGQHRYQMAARKGWPISSLLVKEQGCYYQDLYFRLGCTKTEGYFAFTLEAVIVGHHRVAIISTLSDAISH
jgi:hypothetical protein